MKAYRIDTKNRTVHLGELDSPTLCDGEVLLKCLSWSICRTDVSQIRMELGEDADGEIPGHEVLAEVVESKDSRFDIGDNIVYMGATDFGGATEYRTLKCVLPGDPIRGKEGSATSWFWTERNFYDVPGAAVVKIPKENEILRQYGSLLEPLSCILRAMEKYEPSAGENAVILGAGCIGVLTLQCMKNIYGVNRVAVLDVDAAKLARMQEVYGEQYGDTLMTFHVTEPSENQRKEFLQDPNKPIWEFHRNTVDYKVSEYIELLRSDNGDLDRLVQETHGAFATYLFEALPPFPRDAEFPHTRFMGANLLAPDSKYILFSAEGIEERTKFFWPILSNGLNLHAAGFDQRCYPMPQTAAILQKAMAYANSGMIDLHKLVTKEIDFHHEEDVKTAISKYGTGDYMWKTMVRIA